MFRSLWTIIREHATEPCQSYSYCRDHQLKYIVKIVVQWQYMFRFVECALGAVQRVTRHTPHVEVQG